MPTAACLRMGLIVLVILLVILLFCTFVPNLKTAIERAEERRRNQDGSMLILPGPGQIPETIIITVYV